MENSVVRAKKLQFFNFNFGRKPQKSALPRFYSDLNDMVQIQKRVRFHAADVEPELVRARLGKRFPVFRVMARRRNVEAHRAQTENVTRFGRDRVRRVQHKRDVGIRAERDCNRVHVRKVPTFERKRFQALSKREFNACMRMVQSRIQSRLHRDGAVAFKKFCGRESPFAEIGIDPRISQGFVLRPKDERFRVKAEEERCDGKEAKNVRKGEAQRKAFHFFFFKNPKMTMMISRHAPRKMASSSEPVPLTAICEMRMCKGSPRFTFQPGVISKRAACSL